MGAVDRHAQGGSVLVQSGQSFACKFIVFCNRSLRDSSKFVRVHLLPLQTENPVITLPCTNTRLIPMQLTELTTRVRPFELGGGSLFQLQGESHNRQSTSGLGGGRELDVSGDAVKTVSHGREDKLASVTEAQWADAQEQLRVAAAAAAATAAAAAAKSQEPPEDFYDNVFDCLIMEDPVFAMDGFTYERRRIEEWLASNSRSYNLNTPSAPHYSYLCVTCGVHTCEDVHLTPS